MNPTIRLINNRKSLRSYAHKAVERDVKNQIIHAAMRAPTAGNMMLYSILEVDSQHKKERLVESCDHQPFIAKAPFVLIFLADYQRTFDHYLHSGVEEYCRREGRTMRTPGEGDFLLACNDALIAAQTSVLAAESLGLGSCYIGDIMENWETHRDMFSLPDYVFPVTMVCYGYPKTEYEKEKPVLRFAPGYIHFKDEYKRLSPREFRDMYAPYEKEFYSGITFKNNAENPGQHNYARKFDSDFSREMTRSVRAALTLWQSQEKGRDS
ncbi:MAG: nitroreductase family protein [Spirochaetales bacterium]|nr:nitroreductase family protein [Spirochaetales bacterium]